MGGGGVKGTPLQQNSIRVPDRLLLLELWCFLKGGGGSNDVSTASKLSKMMAGGELWGGGYSKSEDFLEDNIFCSF